MGDGKGVGKTNCWHRVVGQVVKLVPWVKFVQCDYGQTTWPMKTESKEDMEGRETRIKKIDD